MGQHKKEGGGEKANKHLNRLGYIFIFSLLTAFIYTLFFIDSTWNC